MKSMKVTSCKILIEFTNAPGRIETTRKKNISLDETVANTKKHNISVTFITFGIRTTIEIKVKGYAVASTPLNRLIKPETDREHYFNHLPVSWRHKTAPPLNSTYHPPRILLHRLCDERNHFKNVQGQWKLPHVPYEGGNNVSARDSE